MLADSTLMGRPPCRLPAPAGKIITPTKKLNAPTLFEQLGALTEVSLKGHSLTVAPSVNNSTTETQQQEQLANGAPPYSVNSGWLRLALKKRIVHRDAVIVHAQVRLWMNKKYEGYCWAGFDAIADELDMSSRHVMRQIQALEDLGFIYRERRDGTSNRYRAVDRPGDWNTSWGPIPKDWKKLAAEFDKALAAPRVDKPKRKLKRKAKTEGSDSESHPEAVTPSHTGSDSESPNIALRDLTLKETKERVESDPPPPVQAVDPMAVKATDYLLDAFAAFNSTARLKTTGKATLDMDRLNRLGPAGIETPYEIDYYEIRAMIDWLFSGAARPWLSGNVRSPGKLRQHWQELEIAKNQPAQRTQANSGPGSRPDHTMDDIFELHAQLFPESETA